MQGRRSYHNLPPTKHNNLNKISADAAKKITRAVAYVQLISDKQKVFCREIGKQIDFQLTFLTLTLPSRQIHTDQQIRRDLLHHFITILERKYKVTHYVQRSERQRNGNLHFHIVTNKFLPHQEIKDLWNNIINKLGYVDEYRKNMKAYHGNNLRIRKDLIKYWPVKSQIKAYKTGIANDWSSPNTTDIHSLRLINNVKSYICKYISKQTRLNHERIKGRKEGHNQIYFKLNPSTSEGVLPFLRDNITVGKLWSCSRSLSNLHGGKDVVDSIYKEEFKKIQSDIRSRYFRKEYCEILFFDFELLKELKCVNLLSLFNQFLTSRFDYHIQLNI